MLLIQTLSNVSNEAVENATGKGWRHWIDFLEKQAAGALPYKAIIGLLTQQGKISSEWWCRKIAAGYQQYKGSRVTGQTQDAGFQIGVRKTFPISVAQAWDLLTTAPGVDAWLGAALPATMEQGGTFRAGNEVTGNIRVFKPGSHLRMSWQPAGWNNNSTLQVRVLPAGNQCTISFHHEKLADVCQREQMKQHWQGVLEKLEKLI